MRLNLSCELEDSRGGDTCEQNVQVVLARPFIDPSLMHGRILFKCITDNNRPDHVGGETQLTAQNSLQAEATQQLSAPTLTTESTTPTLHFGEVGTTTQTETNGYESKAHSVGHFEDTRLLERSVLIGVFNWTIAESAQTPLLRAELHKLLRDYPRNAMIMDQFALYRGDIEVTVRLNTNQFYYGSLMIALYPSNKTGQFIDEVAVLDPTILTASSAESVIKTWTYSYPYSWLRRPNIQTQPINLAIWVLGPLMRAKDDMPDAISVSVWARWKNIQLAYPHLVETPEAQSGQGSMSVLMPKIGGPSSPTAAVDNGIHQATNVLKGIASSAIDDAGSVAGGLADMVVGGVGNFLGFLDKPDQVDHQNPMIVEAAKDQFCADIPDTNVSVSMYKSRYVDPDTARMPMTKSWTLSDYARIPGLRWYTEFTARGANVGIQPLHYLHTVNLIPADYALMCSSYWRGSLKVCLQFFTSSFISARFVVEYVNVGLTGSDMSTDYVNGIAKVINVKGDTTDTFTLPWLDDNMWSGDANLFIKITCISDIASTDTASTPTIQLAVWVSGGDDIQFAWPRVPTFEDLPFRPLSEAPVPKYDLGAAEAQSAMGAIFQQKFPPIVDNCFYDVDQGYATGEQLGPMSDIAKRYSVYQTEESAVDTIGKDCLDVCPDIVAVPSQQLSPDRKSVV